MSDNKAAGYNNGWTQYQKLVLAELERHDSRQFVLEKELVDLKLNQAKMTLEITNLSNGIKDLGENIKAAIVDLKSARNDIITQRMDLTSIKVKVGLVSFLASVFTSAAAAAIFKLLLQN